ncbi:hypothetical protein HPP92_006568 [Vanilla planifolia]|uniref:Uncharacterized protein n=1 Tax=Vanilla planifolia TaxID=51239 RepID=A0A835RRR9_VANPL|nr:hypothetical protein HPP92_006568 [Vanilla planifolia]
MKLDPKGYEASFSLCTGHLKSSYISFLTIHASLCRRTFGLKDVDDLKMFLADMTPYYPRRLVEFPH